MKKTVFLKTCLTKAIMLILVLFLSNCQEREDPIQENNHTASEIHKVKVNDYWNQLKLNSNEEQLSIIEELSTAIDINSLKIYDLRTTEKLLIADAKSLQGLDGITKVIFYLNENKIVRSNIVTLKTNETNRNYDNVISAVLNADKIGFNYSGEITFLSLSKTKLLYNKYDQGKIIENATLSPTRKGQRTGKTQASCVEYWYIIRYGGEIISQVLLFTICDCSGGGGGGGGGGGEEASKMSNCDNGGTIFLGGSGASSSTSYKPNLPLHPVQNQVYRFTDPDGVSTDYIFSTLTNSWQILQVMLPNIIIANNRDNYGILEYQFPVNNQKVFDPSTRIFYTYEQGSDSWIGVPATDISITQAIEDQIDDSQLDACTKAILDKMKNLKQNDIAAMLSNFSGARSTYKMNVSTGQINDPTVWARTTSTGLNSDINMVFSQDYINGQDSPSRPTDLSVATTMAHEIIHAYLISILNENQSLGAAIIFDFPTIYEAYVQNEIAKNPSILPNAHHELIAEKYVNSIASIIQEFHTGQPVTSGVPDQVYLDMAWGGLTDTTIFNSRYPNNPNDKNYKDRERILGRIIAEKKGEIYGIYSPIGTPCKK